MSTFLSYKVQELYEAVEKGRSDPEFQFVDASSCVIKRRALSEKIGMLLPDELESEQFYLKALETLAPLFHETHLLLSNNHPKIQDSPFHWLTESLIISDGLRSNFSNVEENDTIFFVAVITSMMERSLGNVLQTVHGPKFQVPALFRDLLRLPELEQLLYPELAFLLRVLMGSPKSLNLRNVVWHGFGTLDAIKPYFSSVLTACVLTITKELEIPAVTERDNFSLEPVMKIHREAFKNVGFDLVNFLEVLKTDQPLLRRLISTQLSLISRSVDLYRSGSYCRSIILLIPLWESMSRCVYIKANDLDEDRLITAESSELYITFDTMLKEDIDGGKMNEYIPTIGTHHAEFLLDILNMPFGPRIRDKISHGEVNLSTNEDHFRAGCELIMTSMVYQISPASSFDHYIPQHHPSSILKEKLSEVRDCLENLMATELRPGRIDDDFMIEDLAKKSIVYIFRVDGIESVQKCSGNQPKQGCTLFRQKMEYEILSVDMKILEEIEEAVTNIRENLSVTRLKLLEKSLRSRQRTTYKKMLEASPKICIGYGMILDLILEDFNSFMEKSLDQSKVKVKKQKKILKTSENLAIFVKIGKNKWDEAIELIKSELL